MEPAGSIDPADWTTIWQSELSALAVDREAHEALTALALAWTAASHDRRGGGDDGPAGCPGPDAPPGPAAAGAASGPGNELERLRRRIAELESAAPGGGR